MLNESPSFIPKSVFNNAYNKCIWGFPKELMKYGNHIANSETFGTAREKMEAIGCLMTLAQNGDKACNHLVAKKQGLASSADLVLRADDMLKFYEMNSFPNILWQALKALEMISQAVCLTQSDGLKITYGNSRGYNCNLKVEYLPSQKDR